MNLWNLIGLIAWLLILAYLIFIVMNIRTRHIRMIVANQGRAGTIMTDIVEVLVLFGLLWGMAWVTWLRPVDYGDTAAISVKHSYANLVLKTGDTHSYYVSVRSGNGKDPVRYFTYWTEGAKYEITSRNATIADGPEPLTIAASGYPWSKKTLTKMDKITEKAYVATYSGTYKPTFLNGLGMHVGHNAQRFSILRIPNETFVRIDPLEDED